MLELEKQYQYYMAHEQEFLAQFEGKYLVISEEFEVSAIDTKKDAYNYGADTHGLGNFLLQQCTYDATHTDWNGYHL